MKHSQQRWRKLLLAMAMCAVGIGLAVFFFRPERRWLYTGQLHEAIEDADRIVVRGGLVFDDEDYVVSVEEQSPIMFEVTDPSEIRGVYRNLDFETRLGTIGDICACSGFPRIEWYEGERRVALTFAKHGEALAWNHYKVHADLTANSSKWLAEWLIENGGLVDAKTLFREFRGQNERKQSE